MKELSAGMFLILWMAGIILAKGFWLTFAACIVPFYSWYLVVELAIKQLGVL